MAEYPPPKYIDAIFNPINFEPPTITPISATGPVTTDPLEAQISTSYKTENPSGTFIDYFKNITQREIITHLSHWRYGASSFGGISDFSASIPYLYEADASFVISDQPYNGVSDIDSDVVDPIFTWKEYKKNRLLNLPLTIEDKIFAYLPNVTLLPATANIPAGLRTNLLGGYLELTRTLPTQFTIIFNIYDYKKQPKIFNFYMNEFLISAESDNMTIYHYNSTTNIFESTGVRSSFIHDVPNQPHFTTGISFDFINNKVCFGSDLLVNELVSGISTTRNLITRTDSMEPVSFVNSTEYLIDIRNSLNLFGNGQYYGGDGVLRSFGPITGWSMTNPMTWKFRLGKAQNGVSIDNDSSLHEFHIYNRYMDYKELSQNVFFVSDSINRRKQPTQLS
jgi:hypothetical protein